MITYELYEEYEDFQFYNRSSSKDAVYKIASERITFQFYNRSSFDLMHSAGVKLTMLSIL